LQTSQTQEFFAMFPERYSSPKTPIVASNLTTTQQLTPTSTTDEPNAISVSVYNIIYMVFYNFIILLFYQLIGSQT
jgi:hypothetical protein